MSTRSLGMLCIVGGTIILLDSVRQIAAGTDEFDTLFLLAGIMWSVGGIAALVGMIRLNAIGPNTVVRALAFIPIIGFGLLIVANMVDLADMATTTDLIAGIAWVSILAGMMLVGILTIAAKTWYGWRRFVPLLTIVLVPVGVGLGSAAGNLGLGTAVVWLAWILLGYVVATAAPAAARQPVLTTS